MTSHFLPVESTPKYVDYVGELLDNHIEDYPIGSWSLLLSTFVLVLCGFMASFRFARHGNIGNLCACFRTLVFTAMADPFLYIVGAKSFPTLMLIFLVLNWAMLLLEICLVAGMTYQLTAEGVESEPLIVFGVILQLVWLGEHEWWPEVFDLSRFILLNLLFWKVLLYFMIPLVSVSFIDVPELDGRGFSHGYSRMFLLSIIEILCGLIPGTWMNHLEKVNAATQQTANMAPPASATIAPPASATIAPPASATIAPQASATRSIDNDNVVTTCNICFGNEDRVFTCCICFDKPPNQIFAPCNHAVICGTCLPPYQHTPRGGLCPNCRQPYDSVETLYLS